MGAPTSALLAEVFIQHSEHYYLINILKKHHIIDYCRYLDDILIRYNLVVILSSGCYTLDAEIIVKACAVKAGLNRC
jgi:hypothetical protein